MKISNQLSILIGLLFLISCNHDQKNLNESPQIYQSDIKELTDEDYPDNNDIETRSELWNKYEHSSFNVIRNGKNDFSIFILPENKYSDSIIIENINLLAWMPTIPDHIAKDDYLKKIGIINAEWNRQQVRFNNKDFKIGISNEEGAITHRVDLARNCLNSYAWEVITFTEDNAPLYHGWFDFPKELYRELFNEVNEGKLLFEDYVDFLENYTEPEKDIINFDVLRKVVDEKEVGFDDLRMGWYPMTGARKSKYKNIVCPQNPSTINEMLTDSTTYSTFQWPGFYDTKDPRATTLSMLGIPKKVIVRKTISNNNLNENCFEFDITFARNTDTSYLTRVVIGGVRESELFQLPLQDYNNAYKMPMGIGNHGFYEPYKKATNNNVSNSPYYGLIIDSEGKWVDSHFFGVDGPILHLDENDPNLLHFWLLSFERHAMVSHLTFNLNN